MQTEANSTSLEDQIANFDPNSPEALAALEQGIFGEEGNALTPELDSSTDETGGEKKAAAAKIDGGEGSEKQDEKQVAAAATQHAAEEGAPSGAAVPEGVQAKDGRHVIPYSVLERERDRAARAEATANALAEEIDRLKAGKPAQAATVQLSAEDLDQLEQDLPMVAKVIRSNMAAIEQLTGTVTQLRRDQEITAQTQQRSVEDEIDAAISANPDLAAWRDAANRKDNPDPLMWNRAAAIDATLREDPEWKDKTFAERFEKATETVKLLYGVPAAVTPPAPKPQEPKPEDIKQVAEAKLKETPAPVPNTLSDIPGSAAPTQSAIETIENASAVQIGQKFLSMTTDQQDAYLASLGI